MNPKKKTPAIVRILMFSAFTTFIWIGFEVYRALTIKPSPSVSIETLAPLSATLDSSTLNTLQNRLQLNDSEIGDTVIQTIEENE